jgi:hypothetical protein
MEYNKQPEMKRINTHKWDTPERASITEQSRIMDLNEAYRQGAEAQLAADKSHCAECKARQKAEIEFYRKGFVHFRQGIRNNLFTYYPNNIGSNDDELIDAVGKAVKEIESLKAEKQEMIKELTEGQLLHSFTNPHVKQEWDKFRQRHSK